jgi:hypothetical protein
MKLFIKFLCIIAVAAFATHVLASNISTVETDAVNTHVTIDSNPIVTAIGSAPGTVNGHTYSSYAVFAQDSTGSVELFGAMPTNNPATSPVQYTPTVGDALFVQGAVSPFHQIPEIGSLSNVYATSSGNTFTTPVFTIPQLMSGGATLSLSQAGYLLQLQNVTIYTDPAATIPAVGLFPNANGTYYLSDGVNTNIMEMFFWVTSYSADAQLIGTPIPTGPVSFNGFVSQSTGFAPEITPLAFIPEPSSVALVGCGLLGLLAMYRRRK